MQTFTAEPLLPILVVPAKAEAAGQIIGAAQPSEHALGLQPSPTDHLQPLPQLRKISRVVETPAQGGKGGRGGRVKSFHLPPPWIHHFLSQGALKPSSASFSAGTEALPWKTALQPQAHRCTFSVGTEVLPAPRRGPSLDGGRTATWSPALSLPARCRFLKRFQG